MSRISAIRPSAWLATLAFIAMALPMAAAAPPTITSFDPVDCYVGEYGQPVTINGTGFTWDSSVSLGGKAASFRVNSSTKITAYVPVSSTSNPISVKTPNGTAYGQKPFYVKPIPRPVISSFGPTFAYAGESGKSITITGNYFKGITTTKAYSGVIAVSIGNLPAASFSVISDTTIKAVVPDNAVSFGISVTSAGGTGYSMDAFEIRAIPAPTITTFTPTSVYTGETGKPVTINGTNFLGIGAASKKVTGVSAVTVGGIATTFNLVSPTQLIATVPAGATTNALSVTTSGGTAYSKDCFIVNPIPCPTVSSFDPTSIYGVASNRTVDVFGTNFNGIGAINNKVTGTTAVSVGGVAAATWNVISDTHMTIVVPANAVSGPIAITTAGGTGYGNDPFYIKPVPLPVVSSFLPIRGKVEDTVTITGQYFKGIGDLGAIFTGVTAVTIGGVAATDVVVVNDTMITAKVGALASNNGITVTTSGGIGYSHNFFEVIVPQVPTITELSTDRGSVGDTVTITGTNFDPVNGKTTVEFNGKATTIRLGSVTTTTSITVLVPDTTTGLITVTTPGGTATSAGRFWIYQTPTITSFTPENGLFGDVIDIYGTNFTDTSSVKFNDIDALFTEMSDTFISATVPAGNTTGKITVTTPKGPIVSADTFGLNPPPFIDHLSAYTGIVGQVITITGINLSHATAVYFNGTKCANVPSVTDTVITAGVPSGATTGYISVVTTDGTAYSDDYFEVIPAPTITSFTAEFGSAGDIVRIYGTNFTDSTSVMFTNNIPAASVLVWSSTFITVTVPAAAESGFIYATTVGGTARSINYYRTIPVITELLPSSGKAGEWITIKGTNLLNWIDITLNGITFDDGRNMGATSVEVQVPVGATTGKVKVITPDYEGVSLTAFTVTH